MNCDKDHWLPVGTVPPDNPHCVEFDGSLIPDCGQYNLNNQTSYYHIHEYSACPSLVCKAVTVSLWCVVLQTAAGSGSAAPRVPACSSAPPAPRRTSSASARRPSSSTAGHSNNIVWRHYYRVKIFLISLIIFSRVR